MSGSLVRYAVPPKIYPDDCRRVDESRKTIILDLDSTLVYTYVDKPEAYNGADYWLLDDVAEEDGEVTTYYVLIRPYARRFIERCMDHYNVAFFTAAEREYAEPILDKLCPEVSAERRYYRDSCLVSDNIFTKNLSTLVGLPFDERKTFLFDDNAPDNTIPRENGIFCSQFAPEDDNDGSELTVNGLLEDNALEAFADLFCSDRFLKADDVRIPLMEYDRLFNKRLAEPGET